MLGLHGHHVAFRGLPGVEIAALADSNADGIDDLIALTGAKKHYRTFEEMLDNEKLDIVVLCSRHPGDHFQQIRHAAERGVHVYTEKPMTVSLAEADKIVALVERYGIKLLVAHFARYDLGFRTMKKIVEAGEIGRPLTAYGKGKCDHRGGGEDLAVLGVHILDILIFIFGEPTAVRAEVLTNGIPIVATDRTATIEPVGPTAGDDIFATFRFPGGVRGIFESRQGLLAESGGSVHMGVTVQGTKGSVTLRFCDGVPEDELRISRTPGPVEDHASYETVPLIEDRVIPRAYPLDFSLCGHTDICSARWILEANRFAAWDLLQAIEGGSKPISNERTARLALEMIYGIYASHLSDGAIRFPLLDRANPLGG
jgi:predicted dehydrogenase